MSNVKLPVQKRKYSESKWKKDNRRMERYLELYWIPVVDTVSNSESQHFLLSLYSTGIASKVFCIELQHNFKGKSIRVFEKQSKGKAQKVDIFFARVEIEEKRD